MMAANGTAGLTENETMTLEITIAMDNAAFSDDWRQEAARILEVFAQRIKQHSGYGPDAPGDEHPLFDVNGNRVGLAKIA